MHNNHLDNGPRTKGCGGALPARSRINTFEPEWTDVFHELCNLTTRTVLIQEIMGTEVSDQKIKEAGNRYFQEIGVKASRPRGIKKSTSAVAFLAREAERKDCAYLLGLYYGHSESRSQDPGREFQYYPRALRLIETYKRYLADICETSDPRDARVSFETFYLMLTALSTQKIKRIKCHHCGSFSLATPVQTAKPKCAVCESFNLDIDAAKEKLALRMKRRFDDMYGQAANG